MTLEEPVNGVARNTRLLEGVIANLPMFRDTAAHQRAEIASQARLRSLRRGAAACRVGEVMPGILVVAYGQLKLALPRPEGEERVVRIVGANETFGEAPALLNRPAPFDAVALGDSMLVVIPRLPVLRLLELHPVVAHGVVANLAESYLSLLSELQALAQRNGVQRLASYLVSLVEPHQDADGLRVRLPASKTTVAARLSIQKETLSRMLRDLSERGCIRVEGREITILDRARLDGLAA
jgi:CRP/FNR family transcriptional regulator, dissimilatory nitrate respiration regulator